MVSQESPKDCMPTQYKDYYKILGVPKTASKDDIRKAFKRLAREYHPDVAKDKSVGEEKFKDVNEAYEVLSDPVKRQKYDSLGNSWNRGAPQSHPFENGTSFREADFEFSGTGFSDFFEQLFGSGGRSFRQPGSFGGGHPGQDLSPQKGGDIEGDVMVTLHEVIHGSIRSISIKSGSSTGAETLKVKIPVGIQEGQRIRIGGKGQPGRNGGPPGDVYLRIRYAQHPDFTVKGSDLHYELVIAPWQAVLGATLNVPTLDGSVNVKVPAGTQPGQQLRIREKGLPMPNNLKGNLIVEIDIKIPTDLSPGTRKLWEQLAATSGWEAQK